MDNDISSLSLTLADRDSMVLEPAEHISHSPLIQQTALDASRSYIMAGYPLFSNLPAKPIENLHRAEHFLGPPLYSTSLDNLLADNAILSENLIGIPVSAPSSSPFEDLRASVSTNIYNASNLPMEASRNCGDNGSEAGREFSEPKKHTNQNTQSNYKWDYEEILSHRAIFGDTHFSGVCQSYPVKQSKCRMEMDYPYGLNLSNKHPSSPMTCKPSFIHVPTVPDQGSRIRYSGLTQVSSTENRCADSGGLRLGLGSEQVSINSMELSLDFGSSRPTEIPHVLLGSKYLHIVHQILVEVISSVLQNINNLGDLIDRVGHEREMCNSSSGSDEREVLAVSSKEFPFSCGEVKYKSCKKPVLQRQELETKKDLLDLVEMVDRKYNQCFDQIQIAISSFKAITGCDLQLNHPFAIQALSNLFKRLRRRITNQIYLIGENFSCEIMKEKAYGSSFIKNRWDLQQLKRAEHQPWKPQRGLPEKSVSILRTWLFENFLHPYPKDTEKHLLARRSGLTRNQVSNWFINARVRLWKPMIEEMYMEIKKKDQIGEGAIRDQTVP